MPTHDDNTGLLNLALQQYGAARRLRWVLALSLILNAALIGWLWSLALVPWGQP